MDRRTGRGRIIGQYCRSQNSRLVFAKAFANRVWVIQAIDFIRRASGWALLELAVIF